MSDREVVAAADRERRRTWVAAGALLVLSALVAAMARGALTGIRPAGEWLFAAGAIIFAVGLGRSGSVTSRRVLGTAATILLAVAPLTQGIWAAFVPEDETNPNTVEDISATVAMVYYDIVFACAIVSVVQIARARVVPSPWRWAPAWALVWTIVTVGIGLNLFGSVTIGSPVAALGSALVSYGPAVAVAFLGLLGVVLGRLQTNVRQNIESGARRRRR